MVPALLFFLMAVMVLCLSPFDRTDSTDFWLAAALVLSGIQRGNQAFFFWWEIETIQDFVIFIFRRPGERPYDENRSAGDDRLDG